MGILVGSKTKMECDGTDCEKSSQPNHDQRVAVENAYTSGWIKNSSNGKTFCPNCKHSKN